MGSWARRWVAREGRSLCITSCSRSFSPLRGGRPGKHLNLNLGTRSQNPLSSVGEPPSILNSTARMERTCFCQTCLLRDKRDCQIANSSTNIRETAASFTESDEASSLGAQNTSI